MSWGNYGWRPYVPVGERRAKAALQMAKLSKKNGMAAAPVCIEGRQIATTFWGKAWCDNLEAYSDFENRLPRGRTYVRNGSVVDLQIAPGRVSARVCGSELYKIEIKIKPLVPAAWKAIQKQCAGKIDSLIELLQGRLSSAVMQVVTRQNGGLFPAPKEIDLDCSCPDWAELCKHVAAALYGVGARLDSRPELLFLLRGVDPAELISRASASEAVRQDTGAAAPALSDAEIADVFGIEVQPGAPGNPPLAPAQPLTPAAEIEAAPGTGKTSGSSKKTKAPTIPKTPKPRTAARRRLSPEALKLIAAAQKRRWARVHRAARA